LLPEEEDVFLFLLAWVTVEDEGSGRAFGPAPAGMFVDLELTSIERDGFERNHQLRPSLVGLDPGTRQVLTDAGVDPAMVEAEISRRLNLPIPWVCRPGAEGATDPTAQVRRRRRCQARLRRRLRVAVVPAGTSASSPG
jgi:hypothetical protein